MLDLFNLPTPQGCDIQKFFCGPSLLSNAEFSWEKPRGVSFIYILLIGNGGAGNATNGGGSGGVTVWFGNANNVPDSLIILPASNQITVSVRNTSSTAITLLRANGTNNATAATSQAAGVFGASGFYQSIAGDNGTSGAVTASSTTFLSFGGGASSAQAANYGYSSNTSSTNANGFFQMQPIIVGTSGMGNGRGSVGSGAGINGTQSTQSMALIASW
jgi:hypothetical protein